MCKPWYRILLYYSLADSFHTPRELFPPDLLWHLHHHHHHLNIIFISIFVPIIITIIVIASVYSVGVVPGGGLSAVWWRGPIGPMPVRPGASPAMAFLANCPRITRRAEQERSGIISECGNSTPSWSLSSASWNFFFGRWGTLCRGTSQPCPNSGGCPYNHRQKTSSSFKHRL